MMRTAFRIAALTLVVALSAPTLQACSDRAPVAESETLIEPPPDDPAVLAAMKQAIDTQNVFWTKFDAREPGVTNYAVKLGMTGSDGYKEFIWAEPIRREGGEVVARLANEPVHLTGLQLGSEVRVKQDLVFDWTYEKGGKAFGHFTTRALMRHATPAQRAETEGLLAPTPLEPSAH
jgi:uncharacterized protein YegJ (DUF2314 family)